MHSFNLIKNDVRIVLKMNNGGETNAFTRRWIASTSSSSSTMSSSGNAPSSTRVSGNVKIPIMSSHNVGIASSLSKAMADNSYGYQRAGWKSTNSSNTYASLAFLSSCAVASFGLLMNGDSLMKNHIAMNQPVENKQDGNVAPTTAAAPNENVPKSDKEKPANVVTTTKWTFYSGKHISPESAKNFLLIAGNGNKPLAQEVSKYLGVSLANAELSKFSDGEINVKILENVRGKHCFIIQPTCAPVNDNLIELLLLISCLRRSSANKITVVMPYYGYARADRRLASRAPISARDVATMLETVGADRIMFVDVHSGQAQGFFSHDVTTDNIPAVKVGALYFSEMRDLKNPIIVATRSAGVARVKEFRDILVSQSRVISNPNISDPLIAMVMRPLRGRLQPGTTKPLKKQKTSPNSDAAAALRPEQEESGSDEENDEDTQPQDEQYQSQSQSQSQQSDAPKKIPHLELVGAGNSVEGCDCIIVTDIVDTARSLSEAAMFLKAKGARHVYAFASHGVFSEGALDRIKAAGIDKVVVSNTVPSAPGEAEKYPMVVRLSLAPLIAEAIRRVHEKEPMSNVIE